MNLTTQLLNRLPAWLRPGDELPEYPVDATALAWLIAALAAATIGHLGSVPLWLPVACLLLAVWRLTAAVRGAHGVSRLMRWSMAIGLLLMLLITNGLGKGLDKALPMFVAFLWLKLVEVERRSDLIRVGFLAYFLSASHLLTRFDIIAFCWGLLGVATTTAALINAHRPVAVATAVPLRPARAWWRRWWPEHRTRITAPLRSALRLLGIAALPAVVLFVVMPRPPAVTVGFGQGTSGISNTMQPGDLARLARDQTVAFRAQVLSGTIASDDLWWRALVLTRTTGNAWSGDSQRYSNDTAPELVGHGATVAIRVDLLAQREYWVPTLELTTAIKDLREDNGPNAANLNFDSRYEIKRRHNGIYTSPTPIAHACSLVQTAAVGLRQAINDRDSVAFESEFLRRPGQASARVVALAQEWRQAGDAAAVVQLATRWFADQGFTYTLDPGVITGADQLDGFLFEKRQGFCAHFAGATANLLRLAGVPARVVVGYRGGDRNPVTGAITVRKSNAHAWVEAEVAGVWQRLDPTAAVPLAAGQEPPPGTAGATNPGAQPPSTGFMAEVGRGINHLIDAVDFHWNRLIIAFDSEAQLELLKAIGLGFLGLAGPLFALVVASIALVSMWRWWSRAGAPPQSARVRAWRLLRQRLATVGWPSRDDEGPERLAQRLLNRSHSASADKEMPKSEVLMSPVARLTPPAQLTPSAQLTLSAQLTPAAQLQAAALCVELARLSYAPPEAPGAVAAAAERQWIAAVKRWRPGN